MVSIKSGQKKPSSVKALRKKTDRVSHEEEIIDVEYEVVREIATAPSQQTITPMESRDTYQEVNPHSGMGYYHRLMKIDERSRFQKMIPGDESQVTTLFPETSPLKLLSSKEV